MNRAFRRACKDAYRQQKPKDAKKPSLDGQPTWTISESSSQGAAAHGSDSVPADSAVEDDAASSAGGGAGGTGLVAAEQVQPDDDEGESADGPQQVPLATAAKERSRQLRQARCVPIYIILNARIEQVEESQSCMLSE